MKKRQESATAEDLVEHIRTMLSEAEQLAGDSASELVGEKAAALRARLSQAQERLEELYTTAREKVVDGAKAADVTIRSHPYESIAVALGIGVLLGAFLRRGGD